MPTVSDKLLELLEIMWDLLPDLLKSWPKPALHSMRLAPPEHKHNALMMQAFTWESEHDEVSWWTHLAEEIPLLAELGITQLWLPPPHKAMRPGGQGYDAYDLWDLGEFNQKKSISTRWGTKDELLHLTSIAKEHGVDILIDAVLNHKIGADRIETFTAVQVDPTNRMREIGPVREIQGWTAFDFPGRKGKYSKLKWTEEHFSGLDWDDRTKTKGVFRITGGNHKGWSRWVDAENGNYDYLLGIDIDHRHSDVREDLFAWGKWILETTGASGFRLDAIKHMDRRFLREFIRRAREIEGKEQLFAVAEYWSANIHLIEPYIRSLEGLTSFFDVPLHYNLHRASQEGSKFDLRTIFNDTLVKRRPDDAVTFVDNHDTQIGQSLESWVESSFKIQAYALILLRGFGHPCVFYGDLYPNKECYDPIVAEKLKALIKARKSHGYGETVDHLDSANCIGFVRTGSKGRPGCVVVISNIKSGPTNPLEIHITVGKDKAGQKYHGLLDKTQTSVTLDADGSARFPASVSGTQVWVPV